MRKYYLTRRRKGCLSIADPGRRHRIRQVPEHDISIELCRTTILSEGLWGRPFIRQHTQGPCSTHCLVPSTYHRALKRSQLRHCYPVDRAHHTQSHPFVLIHDIRQDLGCRSHADPLLISELMQSALHTEVRLPGGKRSQSSYNDAKTAA